MNRTVSQLMSNLELVVVKRYYKKKMVFLRSCCCCISLETAGIIIAVLGIIGGFFSLFTPSDVNGGLAFQIVIILIGVLSNGCLLIGVILVSYYTETFEKNQIKISKFKPSQCVEKTKLLFDLVNFKCCLNNWTICLLDNGVY